MTNRPVRLQSVGVWILAVSLMGCSSAGSSSTTTNVDTIIEVLRKGEPEEVDRAMWRLYLSGGQAADRLTELLADTDPKVSDVAFALLHEMEQQAVPALLDGIASDSVTVRQGSCDILYVLATRNRVDLDASLSLLTRMRSEQDSGVRSCMANLLSWTVAPSDASATSSLLDALKSCTGDECSSIARALGRLGPDAIPLILEASKEQSGSEFLQWLVEALATMEIVDEAAEEWLAGIVQSQSGWVRYRAAQALPNARGDSGRAVEVLTSWLGDTMEPSRWQAAEILGKMGSRSSSAVRMIVNCLSEDDAHLAKKASEAVSRIGVVSIPALVSAMESPKQRRFAIRSLGLMGPDAIETAPRLRKLIGDADPAMRLEAAQALWRIGAFANEALPILLEDRSELTREALRNPGPGAETTIPQLATMLGDVELTPPAAMALGKLGEKGVPALIYGLKSDDSGVRVWSIKALTEQGSEAGIACELLVEALGDERTRLFARNAILNLCASDETSAQRIAKLISKEGDPRARGELLSLVLDLTGDSSLQRSVLSEGLRDKDVFVRILAEKKRQRLDSRNRDQTNRAVLEGDQRE